LGAAAGQDAGCFRLADVRSGEIAGGPLVGRFILGRLVPEDAALGGVSLAGFRSSVNRRSPGRLAGPRLLVGSFGDA